jgi:hypothetical protein
MVDWDSADDAALRVLPATIKRAEAGDRKAALRLLDVYCWLVRSGRPVYPELQEYLARCFTSLLDGLPADDALHLKNPRHRPPDPHIRLRDEMAAFMVDILRAEGTPRRTAIEKVGFARRYGLRDSRKSLQEVQLPGDEKVRQAV